MAQAALFFSDATLSVKAHKPASDITEAAMGTAGISLFATGRLSDEIKSP